MAVSVPSTLAGFGDLVSEDIQKIFVQRRMASEGGLGMDKVYNVSTSASYYNKDSSMIGTDTANFIGDNSSVVYDGLLQGYDKTYTTKKFGKGLKISDHLWRRGIEFRKITGIVDSLNDSLDDKIEKDAFDPLNNGYSTSYVDDDSQTVSTAGGDAVAFFSASHTREDGGTNWNNVVYDGTTYNMDFEYDALKALRRTASLVLNGRGQQTMFMPDTLVAKYGSTVQSRYEEMQAAISRNMIPGGNENDGAAKVGLPKLIVTKYLDNDAYWFAFDSSFKKDEYGLQWIWCEKPHLLEPELDYDTQLYKRQALMWYDRGANNMRNFYGSEGDNN